MTVVSLARSIGLTFLENMFLYNLLHISIYSHCHNDFLIVTGAAIAGVYRASGFEMAPLYALVWGVGQTIAVIVISFTRILATL